MKQTFFKKLYSLKLKSNLLNWYSAFCKTCQAGINLSKKLWLLPDKHPFIKFK